jgi:mRNA-degrading endonuclease toxin of MazEF toxin-antitoxin module
MSTGMRRNLAQDRVTLPLICVVLPACIRTIGVVRKKSLQLIFPRAPTPSIIKKKHHHNIITYCCYPNTCNMQNLLKIALALTFVALANTQVLVEDFAMSIDSPVNCDQIIDVSKLEGDCCSLNVTAGNGCVLNVVNGNCKVRTLCGSTCLAAWDRSPVRF